MGQTCQSSRLSLHCPRQKGSSNTQSRRHRGRSKALCWVVGPSYKHSFQSGEIGVWCKIYIYIYRSGYVQWMLVISIYKWSVGHVRCLCELSHRLFRLSSYCCQEKRTMGSRRGKLWWRTSMTGLNRQPPVASSSGCRRLPLSGGVRAERSSASSRGRS